MDVKGLVQALALGTVVVNVTHLAKVHAQIAVKEIVRMSVNINQIIIYEKVITSRFFSQICIENVASNGYCSFFYHGNRKIASKSHFRLSRL